MKNINYLSIGSGVPLLFQHGLTANMGQVNGLLRDLKQVKLLAIDCPGHGASSITTDYIPSFDTYANEVLEFLDRQGLQTAILGGISMGSGIAINLALRFPDRVRGLILLRPAWLDETNPANLRILNTAAAFMEEPDGMDKFCALPEFQQIPMVSVRESILGVFRDQQPALRSVILQLVGDRPFNSLSALRAIQVPCVVLGNDNDPLHPFEMARAIHEHIPRSVLKKLTSRYIDHELHGQEVRSSIQQFIEENNFNE